MSWAPVHSEWSEELLNDNLVSPHVGATKLFQSLASGQCQALQLALQSGTDRQTANELKSRHIE